MPNSIIDLLLPEPPPPSVTVPGQDTDGGVGPGTFVHSTDHAERMVARLIEFFRKPRNSAWLRDVVGPQIQSIEDAIAVLFEAFDVNTATGKTLDLLGGVVGELRNDRDDDAFRVAVRTRTLVNQSEGTIEELNQIIESADPTLATTLQEYYPAALVARWFGTWSEIGPKDLYILLRQAKPAGVMFHAVLANNTATDFRWSTVANAGNSTSQSFSSVAGGDGGELQAVLTNE